jgi:hypothetical protein
MVVTFTHEHVYKHPWYGSLAIGVRIHLANRGLHRERVTSAHWRKYAEPNSALSHVLSADTLERNVEPESGELHSRRLLSVQARGASPRPMSLLARLLFAHMLVMS